MCEVINNSSILCNISDQSGSSLSKLFGFKGSLVSLLTEKFNSGGQGSVCLNKHTLLQKGCLYDTLKPQPLNQTNKCVLPSYENKIQLKHSFVNKNPSHLILNSNIMGGSFKKDSFTTSLVSSSFFRSFQPKVVFYDAAQELSNENKAISTKEEFRNNTKTLPLTNKKPMNNLLLEIMFILFRCLFQLFNENRVIIIEEAKRNEFKVITIEDEAKINIKIPLLNKKVLCVLKLASNSKKDFPDLTNNNHDNGEYLNDFFSAIIMSLNSRSFRISFKAFQPKVVFYDATQELSNENRTISTKKGFRNNTKTNNLWEMFFVFLEFLELSNENRIITIEDEAKINIKTPLLNKNVLMQLKLASNSNKDFPDLTNNNHDNGEYLNDFFSAIITCLNGGSFRISFKNQNIIVKLEKMNCKIKEMLSQKHVSNFKAFENLNIINPIIKESETKEMSKKHNSGLKAIEEDVTIIKPERKKNEMTEIWNKKQRTPFIAIKEIKPKMALFSGFKMRFIRFLDEEYEMLKKAALEHGAMVVSDLQFIICTHLIIKEKPKENLALWIGPNSYQLQQKWFWNSIKRQTCCKESLYSSPFANKTLSAPKKLSHSSSQIKSDVLKRKRAEADASHIDCSFPPGCDVIVDSKTLKARHNITKEIHTKKSNTLNKMDTSIIEKPLTKQQCNNAFKDKQTVINNEIACTDLLELLLDNWKDCGFGKPLFEYASKIDTEYSNIMCYATYKKNIDICREQNLKFDELLKKKEGEGFDIMDERGSRLMPITTLQVKRLLENTEDDHPDYADLKSAYEILTRKLEEFSDNVLKIDKQIELKKMSNMIENCPDISDEMEYLEQMDVQSNCFGKKCSNNTLFLFSNQLMICKKVSDRAPSKSTNKSHKFIKTINLSQIQLVKNIVDKDFFQIIVKGSPQPFCFKATLDKRNKFLDKLAKQVQKVEGLSNVEVIKININSNQVHIKQNSSKPFNFIKKSLKNIAAKWSKKTVTCAHV